MRALTKQLHSRLRSELVKRLALPTSVGSFKEVICFGKKKNTCDISYLREPHCFRLVQSTHLVSGGAQKVGQLEAVFSDSAPHMTLRSVP